MDLSYIVVIKSNSCINSDITCTRFPGYIYDNSPKETSIHLGYIPWYQSNQGLASKDELEELLWKTRTPVRGPGYE